MTAISEAFRDGSFVLLPAGKKFPPEQGWPDNFHSFEEASSHNGNVGVKAGNGFVGLDLDNPEAFKGLDLPRTTRWETRPGRYGMLFKCGDVAPTLESLSFKPDLAQIYLTKDGQAVGEIKLQKSYQVIPPSWKSIGNERVDYVLLDDCELAEISFADLLVKLEGLGIGPKKKLETAKERLLAQEQKARQVKGRQLAEDDGDRQRRYALAALESEAKELASTPEGSRNDQLNKAAYNLGGFVAVDLLSESEVIEALEDASQMAGLPEEEIATTIRSGLADGKQNPREIPPPKEGVTMAAETGATKEEPTADPVIKTKALEILEHGDPMRYLVWQAQLSHIGDISYQQILICSIASAASLTTQGIQPGGNGERGSGKSDACRAVYHLVPKDRKLEGSLSAKSLYYLADAGRLTPGTVLFSDDVEFDGILPIFKRSTSAFQEGTQHITVDGSSKRREPRIMLIPPRVVWWLTSVEGVANEQAFDRQYPISTDNSPAHKARVCREIAARRARKEARRGEDEGVLIARAIISDVFENGPFRVVIPQAADAEWTIPADFRGHERYWDLVDALAILRWRQREIDDDGWLVAADQDLIDAKELFMSHKAAHALDLTDSELKVVGALLDGQAKTQKELVEALGIAQSTLAERLKSILSKSTAITEEVLPGNRKTYQVNPNLDISAGYWEGLELIRIKSIGSELIGTLSYCYRSVIGIPIGIEIHSSIRIPDSLSVDKTKCISCDNLGCQFRMYKNVHPKNMNSGEPPIRPITLPNQQQAAPIGTDNPTDTTTITLPISPTDSDIETDKPTITEETAKARSDLQAEENERDREVIAKLGGAWPGPEQIPLKLAAIDLGRFTAADLAAKAKRKPPEALAFLQAARDRGLAVDSMEHAIVKWEWIAPPPGRPEPEAST